MKTQVRKINLFLALFSLLFAVAVAGGLETITIKTSAQCGSCKTRIESALKKVDGVKSAKLDLADKSVTVKYDAAVTTPEKIREAISSTGYDADDLKANPGAFEALPACCKPGGHE